MSAAPHKEKAIAIAGALIANGRRQICRYHDKQGRLIIRLSHGAAIICSTVTK